MPKAKTQLVKQELAFLVSVAELYYEQGLTQAEIGARLQTSRSTVSRALQEAKDKGIVEITIHRQWLHKGVMEHALYHQFDLKALTIIAPNTSHQLIDHLGQVAATYVAQHISDEMTLGVSYGRSIAATIKHIYPQALRGVEVVQIIGALGSSNPLIEGPDLSRELAQKYQGSYRYLHAPLLVEDLRTRELLLAEPLVQDVLAIGKKADIALLGIGAVERSSALWTGYLTPTALEELKAQGAVGHMCAEFFNAEGEIMDVAHNKRTISIGLETLKGIDTVIAVAGGREKSAAILGALRGGFIDVLITDEAAALGIYEELEGQ